MSNLPESVEAARGAILALANDMTDVCDVLAAAFGLPFTSIPKNQEVFWSLPGAVTELAETLNAVATTCANASRRIGRVAHPLPLDERPIRNGQMPPIPPAPETLTDPYEGQTEEEIKAVDEAIRQDIDDDMIRWEGEGGNPGDVHGDDLGDDDEADERHPEDDDPHVLTIPADFERNGHLADDLASGGRPDTRHDEPAAGDNPEPAEPPQRPGRREPAKRKGKKKTPKAR